MQLASAFLGCAIGLVGCTPILSGSAIPDPTSARDQVRVHIDADAPLALRRYVKGGVYEVCTAPCDIDVPVDSREGEPWHWGAPSDAFEVYGEFPEVTPFLLGGRGDTVRIDVRAGSTVAEGVGVTAAGLGGTTVALSLFLTLVFYALDGGEGAAFKPSAVAALVGSHVGGVVLLGVGIPLIVISPTRIEILPKPKQTSARVPFVVQF